MMGRKALIIRLASLRREDISMRIMNQEQGIAKEKSSLKWRSLEFDREDSLTPQARGTDIQ
jgi:hypothetical protein